MDRLRGLFGLLLLACVGYVLWQVVPPIFSNYQFEDIIAQEARAGSYNSRSEQDIQDVIYQKAKDLALPVTRDQIKVEKVNNMVSISVDYKVHVDLPIYPFDMDFSPSTKNKGM